MLIKCLLLFSLIKISNFLRIDLSYSVFFSFSYKKNHKYPCISSIISMKLSRSICEVIKIFPQGKNDQNETMNKTVISEKY